MQLFSEGLVKGTYPDMRKRLQLALMLTRTTAIATSLAFLPITSTAVRAWAAEGDSPTHGITATEDHGRMIYVNEDGPAHERATPAPQPKRSTLVYWSSKESRWKPVASAGTASMRAAQSAAAEVDQYYGHDSTQSANAKIVAANSHARQVSPEEIDQSIVMAAARHNVDPESREGSGEG